MSDLLKRLKSEILYEKLTVSFSIEGRDASGLKKFSLFTASVGRSGEGWPPEEMPIVKSLVSKQVVRETYKDALMRGVISKETCKNELPKVLKALDHSIEIQLGKIEGHDT